MKKPRTRRGKRKESTHDTTEMVVTGIVLFNSPYTQPSYSVLNHTFHFYRIA